MLPTTVWAGRKRRWTIAPQRIRKDVPLNDVPGYAGYGSVAVFGETANPHSKARTDGQLVTPARRRDGPDRIHQAAQGLDARDAARRSAARLEDRVLHAKRPVGAGGSPARTRSLPRRRGRRR